MRFTATIFKSAGFTVVDLETLHVPILGSLAAVTAVTRNTIKGGIVVGADGPLDGLACDVLAARWVIEEEYDGCLGRIGELVLCAGKDEEVGESWPNGQEDGGEGSGCEVHVGVV